MSRKDDLMRWYEMTEEEAIALIEDEDYDDPVELLISTIEECPADEIASFEWDEFFGEGGWDIPGKVIARAFPDILKATKYMEK